MSKIVPVVEKWWQKWNNRLMQPDNMSRAARTTMMKEVNEIVSIRDRTIAALITADPTATHYPGLIEDAKKLIEED